MNDDDSPAQFCQKDAYQSLFGSVGLLASTTRPYISAVHSFLSSYSNKPSTGHMKAALYALHYIHSTHDYGISFTSEDVAPMHSYVHHQPILKHTRMPSHPLQQILPHYLPTAMYVGVHKLVLWLLMVLSFLSSNFVA
jgi:hypothetical protein